MGKKFVELAKSNVQLGTPEWDQAWVEMDLVVCSRGQGRIESTLRLPNHRLFRLGDSSTACPTAEPLPTEVPQQTPPRVPVMFTAGTRHLGSSS